MTQEWKDPGMTVLRTPATFDQYWRGSLVTETVETPTVSEFVIAKHNAGRVTYEQDGEQFDVVGFTPDYMIVDPTSKPTNPKDAVGSDKLPLHLWPETATALGSLGMLDGMLKYGRANFRAVGIRTSIYVDAVKRHVDAYFEGEDEDPDSGLPHLAHALACLAIIVDAEAAGKLTDDRQIRGGWRAWVSKLTPHVKRLKDLHKDKSPHHYTIEDNID